MARVRLIHWDPTEIGTRAGVLKRAGHSVDSSPLDPDSLKGLKASPPDVIVIDLSRSPAQGRDLGVHLRKTLRTRFVPLVFLGGEPDKVERVRELLPDAMYSTWRGSRGAVGKALRSPPPDPVVPDSVFAAYSGTPLVKKLGIKDGSAVALVGAPDGFPETLGKLPEGVTLRAGARGRCDLVIWFARSRREVESRVGKLGDLAGKDGLWIAWQKRASGAGSDLTQAVVREIGLASGLVDFKVCSIDETWSGLKFTRRKREVRS